MLTCPLHVAYWLASLTAPGRPIVLDDALLALTVACLEHWPARALA